jgi:hypothetical protein
MRDVLNTFGTVKSAASAAAVAFAYGVDTLTADGLGLIDNLYIKAKIHDKAPAGTNEKITVTVKHGADTQTMNPLSSETFTKAVWSLGDEVKVKIPVEHQRYLTLEIATGSTTGVGFTAYLERG